jgi:hypothetical protein
LAGSIQKVAQYINIRCSKYPPFPQQKKIQSVLVVLDVFYYMRNINGIGDCQPIGNGYPEKTFSYVHSGNTKTITSHNYKKDVQQVRLTVLNVTHLFHTTQSLSTLMHLFHLGGQFQNCNATIHKLPFPLHHSCKAGNLPCVAQAAQNQFLHTHLFLMYWAEEHNHCGCPIHYLQTLCFIFGHAAL